MNILEAATSSIGAVGQFAKDSLREREYRLIDAESYDDIITFDSCISLDLKTDGEVVSTPIEEGSFMTYNKAVGPDEIDPQLAIQGTDYELQNAITTLKTIQNSTKKVTFVTPVFTWKNLSLENFDFSLKTDNGIGVLYVDMTLIEVREVTAQYSDAKPITSSKSAGSTSAINKGKQQAKEPETKKRVSILSKVKSWFS